MIRDHHGLVIKVYSKLASSFAIESEIEVFLKGLEQAYFDLHNLVAEGTLLLLSHDFIYYKLLKRFSQL